MLLHTIYIHPILSRINGCTKDTNIHRTMWKQKNLIWRPREKLRCLLLGRFGQIENISNTIYEKIS